jgi:hypothetical protein
MTHLPQLHRILVEGAERLERDAHDAGTADGRVHGSGRVAVALRRLGRRRLFIITALGVLLAGSAAALGVVESQPSAPLSGGASVGSGPGASPLRPARYSVSVTPNLTAGAASWCITERIQYPTGIPFGNALALRTLLVDARAFVERSIAAQEVGNQIPFGHTIPPLTPARAKAAERAVDMRVARLLKGLLQPARVRETPGFQRPYRAFLGRFVPHGLASAGSSCGNVTTAGNPFVAANGSTGGVVGAAVASAVYVTTPQVAYVRMSPTLTVRTRADRQLPDGFRVAVAVEQTQTGSGQRQTPAPVALDRNGDVIPTHPNRVRPRDSAVFWQASPTHGVHAPRSPARERPPAAACEIDTSALPGVDLFFGEVVQRLHGFPQLTSRTFLSCAFTEFAYGGYGIQAAILLDARHPGTLPAPLPNSTVARAHPEVLSEPAVQVSGTQFITGRRVGDAWLVVESAGPLRQRLAVLDSLGACVRLSGSCPP